MFKLCIYIYKYIKQGTENNISQQTKCKGCNKFQCKCVVNLMFSYVQK